MDGTTAADLSLEGLHETAGAVADRKGKPAIRSYFELLFANAAGLKCRHSGTALPIWQIGWQLGEVHCRGAQPRRDDLGGGQVGLGDRQHGRLVPGPLTP